MERLLTNLNTHLEDLVALARLYVAHLETTFTDPPQMERHGLRVKAVRDDLHAHAQGIWQALGRGDYALDWPDADPRDLNDLAHYLGAIERYSADEYTFAGHGHKILDVAINARDTYQAS